MTTLQEDAEAPVHANRRTRVVEAGVSVRSTDTRS